MTKIKRLQASAGLSDSFEKGRGQLLALVHCEARLPNEDLALNRKSDEVLELLQQYLVGDLTAEALALQLPTDIEPRKRQ
ncbi:hypothetical protein [Qipengyuania atrilutea]|uniref:Uncharacterized protein n=1 Tax=Qipengyuania atrilutea TaxID=2744473 RepID=A0A850H597_9SPHN|nr:hypothetical protein [Actirhodobacter atriluteus]NVD45836.1 hypothetical protein [Actirhodobacter atriluteus]